MTLPAPPEHAARILVVDDNPTNIAVLEGILDTAGRPLVVRSTTDPTRVVRLCRDFGADLVLLDLHMPGMDGLAVLAALHVVVPADEFLPVLMLTADSSREAREQALAAGAHDFLTKPFDRTEVLLRIGNLLQTRGLHLRLRDHNRALEAQVRRQARLEERLRRERQARRDRVLCVLDSGGPATVFQPIADLRNGDVAGAEALSRFPAQPLRPPNEWFAEAAEVGLGIDLEVSAMQGALGQVEQLPQGAYLSVNASPAALQALATSDLVAAVSAHRLVVELTEHAPIEDYDVLAGILKGLRNQGVRLAVDDAGAGYASLQHILRLQPDIIKLDLKLTQRIDADPARRALASALVTFAAEIGAVIVAEGVEGEGSLRVLRDLGVRYGQGFYLARPGPLPVAPDVLSYLLTATRNSSLEAAPRHTYSC